MGNTDTTQPIRIDKTAYYFLRYIAWRERVTMTDLLTKLVYDFAARMDLGYIWALAARGDLTDPSEFVEKPEAAE